jgi:hypothetical protein
MPGANIICLGYFPADAQRNNPAIAARGFYSSKFERDDANVTTRLKSSPSAGLTVFVPNLLRPSVY